MHIFEREVSGRRYRIAAQSVWDSKAGRSVARQVVLGPAAAPPVADLSATHTVGTRALGDVGALVWMAEQLELVALIDRACMADATGLKISVCHLPPGTSKWNKIEHRMFCHITRNWRGRPLESLEVVVNLIAGTTTTKGLRVRAALDTDEYPTGIKVDDATMALLHLIPDKFHGDWNYAIAPGESDRTKTQPRKLRRKLSK